MAAMEVKYWLLQKNIKVIDNWLEDCIAHFLSEQRDMPIITLCRNAYEQWLLADLTDVGIPCLPRFEEKCRYLSGVYVLQMQSVMDTSVAAYNQLQEIYKSKTEILERDAWRQEKSPRLLKLILTDGINIVEAIESRPLRCLNANLKPGIKLLLQGQIHVLTESILLLKEGNISILGGEVEALLEPNSRVNTLLKSLGIKSEENPFKQKDIHVEPILGQLTPKFNQQKNEKRLQTSIAEDMSETAADQVIAELDIDESVFPELNVDPFFDEEYEIYEDFANIDSELIAREFQTLDFEAFEQDGDDGI